MYIQPGGENDSPQPPVFSVFLCPLVLSAIYADTHIHTRSPFTDEVELKLMERKGNLGTVSWVEVPVACTLCGQKQTI